MYGYVYKTTNLINGKIYIGQHKSKTFDPTYYGSGKILCKAVSKYGKDNFKIDILDWCDTQSKINATERYWIKYYNSNNRDIGYNITTGGEGWSGVHHSEMTRKKISNSKKGCHPNRDYKITDATKFKISNTLKEYYKTHKNPRYGVHLSEETKEKLRQANLGKTYSDEVKAKHKRPAWNKGIPMTDEAKKHLSELNSGKIVKRKTVGQFDKNDNLIATYISCTDASRKTGIGRAYITKCCLGYIKNPNNYIWKYLD